MLESAQNLLKVCRTEGKQEKLREAVRSHYANVRKLKRTIKETRGTISLVAMELTVCENYSFDVFLFLTQPSEM